MSGTPAIFDRTLLRARQRRALALGAETFLLDRVAGDLEERLSAVLRQFQSALDIGTPTGALRHVLEGKVGSAAALDIGGDEILPLAPNSLDLAVSALALQHV